MDRDDEPSAEESFRLSPDDIDRSGGGEGAGGG